MQKLNLASCILINVLFLISLTTSHLPRLDSSSLLNGITDYNSNNKHSDSNDYQFVPPYKAVSHFLQSRNVNRIARYLGDNNVICEVSITREVFSEEGYEFFPKEYINQTCVNSNTDPFIGQSNGVKKPEVCLHNDNEFGCQTLYEDLNVLKKSTKGRKECWEYTTQLVAVGCKCNIRFKY